jgi:hypothetical protein
VIFKWLPWRFFVKRIAQAHGFLDPIALLMQLQRFIQPSEIKEPIELLRAGALLHARGLINNRVIQHNLDWVWPYWVERQFDPTDDAFIPRAFSITHINLTHRNWTALGLPDYPKLPIIDPCGLTTPFFDKWSLDIWLVTKSGQFLLPSKTKNTDQTLDFENDLLVITTKSENNIDQNSTLQIINRAMVVEEAEGPVCRIELEAYAEQDSWLVVSLRPYNPEGIGFVYQVELDEQHKQWTIDNEHVVKFDAKVDRHHISNYRRGDVRANLLDDNNQYSGECEVGMLSTAALFKLENKISPTENSGIGNWHRKITLRVPLEKPALEASSPQTNQQYMTWKKSLEGACQLQIPDSKCQLLFDTAMRTLLLHSSEDIYPGPYTYKRFWFRDAAFIMNALLCVGFNKRTENAIDKFPSRQTSSGYFHSQEGEWDSNGEALWIIDRFCRTNNCVPKPEWRHMIVRGAEWIISKRLPASDKRDTEKYLHAGLLPAGFSAEHLGPNDYYYWDNFWGISGLKAASSMLLSLSKENSNTEALNDKAMALKFSNVAEEYMSTIDANLSQVAKKIKRPAIPASPNRRLDAGAIGSLALGYPNLLCREDDERLLDTVEYLLDSCCFNNGFFQDMTHSGINAYLTLHIAQILMRAGDTRYFGLLQTVADLASPTGQWPEAIHPRTGGGCMGDGQHVWAAAEWVLMIRNCFVREEENSLVIGAGIAKQWLVTEQTLRFGPAPTAFGIVEITIKPLTSDDSAQHVVCWNATWHDKEPKIEIRVPGYQIVPSASGDHAADNNLAGKNKAVIECIL